MRAPIAKVDGLIAMDNNLSCFLGVHHPRSSTDILRYT